jgi:HEAT repeat protein
VKALRDRSGAQRFSPYTINARLRYLEKYPERRPMPARARFEQPPHEFATRFLPPGSDLGGTAESPISVDGIWYSPGPLRIGGRFRGVGLIVCGGDIRISRDVVRADPARDRLGLIAPRGAIRVEARPGPGPTPMRIETALHARDGLQGPPEADVDVIGNLAVGRLARYRMPGTVRLRFDPRHKSGEFGHRYVALGCPQPAAECGPAMSGCSTIDATVPDPLPRTVDPALRRWVASHASYLSRAAARRSSRMRPMPADPPLVEAMRDAASAFRRFAARTAGVCGPAAWMARGAIDAWPAPPAAEAATRDVLDRQARWFAQRLVRGEPRERDDAALRLLMMGRWAASASPELVEALVDRTDSVRLIARIALGQVIPRTPDAARALLAGLDGRDPGLRVAALGALAAMDILDDETRRSAVAPLTRILRAAEPEMRLRSATVLAGPCRRPELAEPTLMALLRNAEPRTRLDAAGVLCRRVPEARQEPAVTALVELLENPRDDSIRCGAASVLSEIGPGALAAVPSLERLAAATSPGTVCAAVEALASILQADARAAPLLARFLGHPSDAVRDAAATAMGKLARRDASEDVRRALEATLERGPPEARAWAARALGGAGPVAGRTRPALVRALASRDPILRHFAAEAVARIEPKPRPDD